MKENIRLVRHPSPSGQERICMLVNGKLTADIPPETALVMAAQLISMARQIQNDANPEKTISDQAVLMRAGAKIGLSNNRKVLAEAHKEAQYNRDLRRYMRNAPGISSREIVGIPTLIKGKPNALVQEK